MSVIGAKLPLMEAQTTAVTVAPHVRASTQVHIFITFEV
jgi:hypothetical protein